MFGTCREKFNYPVCKHVTIGKREILRDFNQIETPKESSFTINIKIKRFSMQKRKRFICKAISVICRGIGTSLLEKASDFCNAPGERTEGKKRLTPENNLLRY